MKCFKKNKNKKRGMGGQAMIIIVLILGATILGVSTIAGFIMLQKIRTVTDVVDSTKSIYAADAGVEWWLYKNFSSALGAASSTQPVFSNGSTLEVVDEPTLVRSIGHAGRSYRAFGLFLDQIDP